MHISLPNDGLEIRPVTRQDLAEVFRVYRQSEDFLALGPVPHASLDMVRADLEISRQAGGIFCAILQSDRHMIGVVDFVPANFEGNPQHAFLELLMIASPWRRQGIGRAVVVAVEDEIKKDTRVTAILSGVQVNNPQAVRFWQNMGYRIVSPPRRLPDQTTAFALRKDLFPVNG